MPTARPRRQLGIEPRELDLTPIASGPLTPADRQELNDFFRRQRAENDQRPEVQALRERVSAQVTS